jgi:alkylation response protein AidB-like acyl-CoA dehydrogenase
MAEYVAPLADIRFVLEHVVDLPALSKIPAFEHADPDTVYGLLDEYARFCEGELAPLNRVGDTHGITHDPKTGTVATAPGWVEAYRKYVEAGWGSVPFPPEHGGGGFPRLVAIAMQEIVTSANLSFSMAPLLSQGAIDAVLHHGDEEQHERYLRRMVSGEWTGTMNLTEPQAGSDVGALTTKAVPADDGSYRITGTKIFITYGEHDMTDQIVHLVLARTPGSPPGTKGISLFIVPKQLLDDRGEPTGGRNGVTCVSVEHKMGIHASPTCVLAYEDAVGYLLGEEHGGMRAMFTMMNNARLSVGLQGLAIAERAMQDAFAYANERQQGRAIGAPAGTSSPIIEHPDVRRMLLTMRALVEAMRGVIYLNAECIDLADAHPDPAERERRQELADLLTPITKAWGTDLGVEVASLAVQVHGGMGYIEETGVAQHYRDARIAPIYEGTNGIQAMDLVGRKLPMRGGAVVRELLDSIEAMDVELSAAPGLEPLRVNLADAVDAVSTATEWLLAHGAADPRDALAGASPYLRMFGFLMGGWAMARRALAADASGRASACFYGEQLLPQVRALLPAVTAGHAALYAGTS